jgi:uncharacterized membrane protein
MYNSYGSPTTLNISERWERVLSYAFLWPGALVMFIIERRNRTVRRHAAQSMLVFGTLNILWWLVGAVSGLVGHFWVIGPAIGWVIGLLGLPVLIVTGILWLFLMFMALMTPDFFLPLGRTYRRLIGN